METQGLFISDSWLSNLSEDNVDTCQERCHIRELLTLLISQTLGGVAEYAPESNPQLHSLPRRGSLPMKVWSHQPWVLTIQKAECYQWYNYQCHPTLAVRRWRSHEVTMSTQIHTKSLSCCTNMILYLENIYHRDVGELSDANGFMGNGWRLIEKVKVMHF